MDSQISDALDLIKSSNNILIHLHPSPDGDSIGSALSMKQALLQFDKEVTIISGDSHPPELFSMLPGFASIKDQTFPETDLSQFDLFIAMDSSNTDQITKKSKVSFPENLKVIVIDHHKSNSSYGTINIVDAASPANCQLLFEVFASWKVEITPEIAICLLVGIYTDSRFRYEGTTDKTFEISSKLTKIYPEFHKVFFDLENNLSDKRVYLLGIALNNIEHYFNNKVAIAVITQNQLKEKNISKEDIENNEISNVLRSVKGWDVDISLIELEPNIFNASFRTRNAELYDVSKAAVALGGGGHQAAAGARLEGDLQTARSKLLDTLKQTYPGLAG
jgi:phosphoesterase RecJ-like protein